MTVSQPIPYRPFGIIKTLLEKLGFQVTHYYEDLVFIEHNAFLLRMEEIAEDVSLLFNTESEQQKRDEIAQIFQQEGRAAGLNIVVAGTYQMKANKEKSTIDIAFQEEQHNI